MGKANAILLAVLGCLPFVVGIGVVLSMSFVPALGILSISSIAVGITLLAIVKLALLREGVWISWGTKNLSVPRKRLYVASYVFLGIGVGAGALALVGSRIAI